MLGEVLKKASKVEGVEGPIDNATLKTEQFDPIGEALAIDQSKTVEGIEGALNDRPLLLESGTNISKTGLGTPNSIYRYQAPNGKTTSDQFFNLDGKIEFQIDFKDHGRWLKGHGHRFSIPGLIRSGHLPENHVQFMLVPKNTTCND